MAFSKILLANQAGRRSKIVSGGYHVSEDSPALVDAGGDETDWAKVVESERSLSLNWRPIV
jgi:hypothetical protein